jgi:hypothetical protein
VFVWRRLMHGCSPQRPGNIILMRRNISSEPETACKGEKQWSLLGHREPARGHFHINSPGVKSTLVNQCWNAGSTATKNSPSNPRCRETIMVQKHHLALPKNHCMAP